MVRSRFGLWFVLLVVAATFATEPRATAHFAAESFNAIGNFGGSLVVELLSDEPVPAPGGMG